MPVFFPIHPRTLKRIAEFGLDMTGIQTCDPLGYLEFLNLTSNAGIVLTDSGGLQEETTILRVPCLTLRYNTERPVTITHGTNIMVGPDKTRILEAVDRIFSGGTPSRARFSSASREVVNSRSAKASVTRRLTSSGIVRSKLRSPAST